MKITNIETICLRVPIIKNFCAWGDDAFLVKVHIDEGYIGLGESDTSPLVATAFISAPESNLYCSGLKRLLIGDNPDTDIAIIKAIREELGEDFELKIDLATKWRTYAHAASMFKRAEKFNLA